MQKPKIIAVDFDGTLAVDRWPEIGEPIFETILLLKEEQAAGAKTILFTNRVNEPLQKAIDFCTYHGIRLDAVNDNLPEVIEAFGVNTRKVFANEYWDDRARDLPHIRRPIKRLAREKNIYSNED